MNYNHLQESLNFEVAIKWLQEDSADDFYPDCLRFRDISSNPADYISKRKHRIFQFDTLHSIMGAVPKKNGMLRDSIYLHPTHRILYLAILHHLLPKLDKEVLPEIYSYRLDSPDDHDCYPFKNRLQRWKEFQNDFRRTCLDPATEAVLITDLAAFYDHIQISSLCEGVKSCLGSKCRGPTESVVNLLSELLESWSKDGYGIPQNLDPSSFLGSFYMQLVDQEIVEKRYRYFRWVDDIRICAKNKEQALRALHDIQHALGKKRLFLAGDKTRILIKGTPEFEELLEVSDDLILSDAESATARGEEEALRSFSKILYDRLTFHAGTGGDDRKFRAFANRLLDIGCYEELRSDVCEKVRGLVLPRLRSHPERSDYWTKMLSVCQGSEILPAASDLLIKHRSLFDWQRFHLWKLLTEYAEEIPDEFFTEAKSAINSPISDLVAYQAIVFLGKHGGNAIREQLFYEHFSAQKTYPVQRAIVIAIQELHPEVRERCYERVQKITRDHEQLIDYLKNREAPDYGVRLRQSRSFAEPPREISESIRSGVGISRGKRVAFRISRAIFDYE